jgi:hypothetical protein
MTLRPETKPAGTWTGQVPVSVSNSLSTSSANQVGTARQIESALPQSLDHLANDDVLDVVQHAQLARPHDGLGNIKSLELLN